MAGPALPDRKPVLGTNVAAITLVNLSDDSGSSDEKHYGNVNDDAASVLIPKNQFKRTRIPELFGDIDIFASQEDKKPRFSIPNFEHQTPLVATPSSQNSIGAGCLEDFEKADLPLDFLEPLSPDVESGCVEDDFATSTPKSGIQAAVAPVVQQNFERHSRSIHGSSLKEDCRQFWKAGDYEGQPTASQILGGMDHVRVHPKFLHSNATSHKWALGAMAELLDNSLDEVPNGATYVNVDMIKSPRDGRPMLLIEDDGGGMDPERMRQCMSLGYSAKSKSANTIGQYGNGFKTSTMRLGADVIVFSKSIGGANDSPTQSVGLLSYTFLRSTRCEDIIVPMVDYEITPFTMQKLLRLSDKEWNENLEIIKKWTPYSTEADLLNQFKGMKVHGTKIIVYNLWEDDEGMLELDFDTNPTDIQVRGTNRDEKKIALAKQLPNSRHFLTYQHSLRSYASILYLRLPTNFCISLRGKQVEHHNLVDDMLYKEVVVYRPQGATKVHTANIVTSVTLGFVKDAAKHMDVQGFNVYHKNRLIKPFWRIWNSASSQGRGVIGFLEANFVEPAHDKQGFEKTTVLARLEGRLLQMQKKYWHKNCHLIGYVNINQKQVNKSPENAAVNSTASHETEQSGKAATKRINVPNDLISKANERFKNKLPSALEAAANNYVNSGTCRSVQHVRHQTVNMQTEKQLQKENSQIRERLHSGSQDSEFGRSRELQARVKELEDQLLKICEERDAIKKERESLSGALEELQKQRELDDYEMRKNLKVALLRVRELETENKRLQLL